MEKATYYGIKIDHYKNLRDVERPAPIHNHYRFDNVQQLLEFFLARGKWPSHCVIAIHRDYDDCSELQAIVSIDTVQGKTSDFVCTVCSIKDRVQLTENMVVDRGSVTEMLFDWRDKTGLVFYRSRPLPSPRIDADDHPTTERYYWPNKSDEYTFEELMVIATIRRKSEQVMCRMADGQVFGVKVTYNGVTPETDHNIHSFDVSIWEGGGARKQSWFTIEKHDLINDTVGQTKLYTAAPVFWHLKEGLKLQSTLTELVSSLPAGAPSTEVYEVPIVINRSITVVQGHYFSGMGEHTLLGSVDSYPVETDAEELLSVIREFKPTDKNDSLTLVRVSDQEKEPARTRRYFQQVSKETGVLTLAEPLTQVAMINTILEQTLRDSFGVRWVGRTDYSAKQLTRRTKPSIKQFIGSIGVVKKIAEILMTSQLPIDVAKDVVTRLMADLLFANLKARTPYHLTKWSDFSVDDNGVVTVTYWTEDADSQS